MDGHVLELELVEQAGRAIHVVLLAQIGDEAREQAGLPHGVLDETAAATQPHPFATPVERAVLDAVARRAPVGDLLVRFKERGTVVFVHMGAPDGGRVLDHLARQAELFHHRRRIAEHARLHVADVQVVVGAFHQRVVQAVLVVIEGRAGHDGVAASGSVRRARRDAVTALFVARDVVGPLLVVHAHVGQVQHVARVGSAARNHFHDAEAECAVVGMIEALVFAARAIRRDAFHRASFTSAGIALEHRRPVRRPLSRKPKSDAANSLTRRVKRHSADEPRRLLRGRRRSFIAFQVG